VQVGKENLTKILWSSGHIYISIWLRIPDVNERRMKIAGDSRNLLPQRVRRIQNDGS